MSAAIKFDSLSWTKKLIAAGVPANQAEAQVELICKAMEDNLCTKQDLREFSGDITLRLKELDANSNVRYKELELKIEGTKLSIEELRKGTLVIIETVNKDSPITIAIEKLRVKFIQHMAKWMIGVSALQATVIVGAFYFMH